LDKQEKSLATAPQARAKLNCKEIEHYESSQYSLDTFFVCTKKVPRSSRAAASETNTNMKDSGFRIIALAISGMMERRNLELVKQTDRLLQKVE
jgi:hypothetical protein